MAKEYSGLPNERVSAANGVDYAYRDTGGQGGLPLVLLQHFRGNLDNWDPALIEALAASRRVVTFDNAGVGGSTGSTPDTIEQMARDAIAFLAAMEIEPGRPARVLHRQLRGAADRADPAGHGPQAHPGLLSAQGAAGMHGWAPEVIDAVGTPQTSPEGYLGRVLQPVGRQPASRPAGTAADVRQNRKPGHGHDVGDPRGAV